MTIVIDASLAAAFLLPDESGPLVERALMHFEAARSAVAPSVFWHELRNTLLMAERRKRIAAAEVPVFLSRARKLPIEDAGAGDDLEIVRLAQTHKLSSYDAAYVALARETGFALATIDLAMRAAATREEVGLFV